jgi:uncharacterized protein with LGFP repeats
VNASIGGRSACWRALVVALLAAAALLVPGPPEAQAANRTISYSVTAQGSVAGNLTEFAAVAQQTFADPRGWSLGGTLGFQRVASGGEFTLVLAAPAVIGAIPGCDAYYSCRVGRNVYINDDRWRTATPSWPHGVALYRQYVIMHEVGHWLGLGHSNCPATGRSAAVMQQQSISLQGCRSNMWPLIAERSQVGRNTGVPVNWSAVDRKYIAMGQERSVLGGPVFWEQPTGGRPGRYQSFQAGTISWSSTTGAFETHGQIDTRYRATGGSGGPLAFPATDTRVTGDRIGRFNRFNGSGGGAIFWTPSTGAQAVYGPIFARWAQLSYERGPLGYPRSSVYEVTGGQQVDFQGGYIRWDRATGQTTVG